MNYQNFISFDIYLLLIICFLSVVCYFISVDLLISISGHWNVYQWYHVDIIEFIQSSDIFLMAKIYIFRKQWLSCILMLELALLEQSSNKYFMEYYSCLAFCFYKLKIYNRSERYYLLYLECNPKHLNTLVCLANIYVSSNQYIKAEIIYERILNIDPENKIAREYLHSS